MGNGCLSSALTAIETIAEFCDYNPPSLMEGSLGKVSTPLQSVLWIVLFS